MQPYKSSVYVPTHVQRGCMEHTFYMWSTRFPRMTVCKPNAEYYMHYSYFKQTSHQLVPYLILGFSKGSIIVSRLYGLPPHQNGPKFASGGDEANPCQYNFIWETPGACPVKPVEVTNGSCALTDAETGYTFDFSPMNQLYHTVAGDDVSYSVVACGHLNFTCHHSSSAAVCQHIHRAEQNANYTCGESSNQTLRYFEGSITVRYTSGDLCSHVHQNRSVLLNMECDRSVYIGEPRYV